MLKADWVIAGAGLTGAVLAERLASQTGASVLLVERRNHIAGNAFDHYNEHGLLVHDYGPHIFHTNSSEVWNYLSAFTTWRPYEHRVLASVEGRLVPVPFNLTSLDMLWPRRLASRLACRLVGHFGLGAKVPILQLIEHPQADVRSFGKYVYESVFENYSRKQWGLAPAELDPDVTARVPVLIGRDDRYFQDTYQAMPALGYTTMVQRMIDTAGVHLLLNTDFLEIRPDLGDTPVIFTGAIDEYFDRGLGPLPYRSLRFEASTSAARAVQPVAQINYPGAGQFTRTTEFKLLTGQQSRLTTVAREFPLDHVPGVNEPFYPVPRPENRTLYQCYLAEARSACPATRFAGRLADYRYYNMDQAVARALSLFHSVAGELKRTA